MYESEKTGPEGEEERGVNPLNYDQKNDLCAQGRRKWTEEKRKHDGARQKGWGKKVKKNYIEWRGGTIF